MKSDNHLFLIFYLTLIFFLNNVAIKINISGLIIVTDTQSWLINISSHKYFIEIADFLSHMLATHRIISDISFYHFTLIVVIDKNISLKVSSSSIYLLNKIKLVRLFSDLNIRSDLSIFTKIVLLLSRT